MGDGIELLIQAGTFVCHRPCIVNYVPGFNGSAIVAGHFNYPIIGIDKQPREAIRIVVTSSYC